MRDRLRAAPLVDWSRQGPDDRAGLPSSAHLNWMPLAAGGYREFRKSGPSAGPIDSFVVRGDDPYTLIGHFRYRDLKRRDMQSCRPQRYTAL